MVEEAEKRDHRRLGAELDLFSFPDEIGSGFPVFHPNGATVRMEMEEHSRRRHIADGYSFVSTPHRAFVRTFSTILGSPNSLLRASWKESSSS